MIRFPSRFVFRQSDALLRNKSSRLARIRTRASSRLVDPRALGRTIQPAPEETECWNSSMILVPHSLKHASPRRACSGERAQIHEERTRIAPPMPARDGPRTRHRILIGISRGVSASLQPSVFHRPDPTRVPWTRRMNPYGEIWQGESPPPGRRRISSFRIPFFRLTETSHANGPR